MHADDMKSLPLFEGLPDDVVASCAARFQETEALAGSSLTQEGDFAYKFFVILEGEAEVQRDFERLGTMGPGDFFGEMGVAEHGRRNARVVATTRCRLASMLGWEFEEMLKEHAAVAERVQAKIDEREARSTDD